MGVADDLLALADYLAKSAAADLEHVSFRRSISTAYYALFHLLIDQAAGTWNGSEAVQLGLQRAFEHKRMMDVSRSVWQGSWRGWSNPQPLPPELREVARFFVKLQEARHQADYDNSKSWTLTEVQDKVADARKAFRSWQKIRTHPPANEYLLGLLVGKKRE